MEKILGVILKDISETGVLKTLFGLLVGLTPYRGVRPPQKKTISV